MRPFNDTTSNGNERALRRGRIVPDGDVNLAYVKAPELSPEANVVVIDTSRTVEENLQDNRKSVLYVANEMGELSTLDGNLSIADEFPVVTDVFDSDDRPLPYVHISRYFHIDASGLTVGNKLADYKGEGIRVVDAEGNEYPSYRIKIAAAKPSESPGGNVGTWYYRVHAFIDTDKREDLHLSYHKAELDNDFTVADRSLDHSEIVNPEPFFQYKPEESEVIDPANYTNKIYSTKSLAAKEALLDKPTTSSDGYKAIVPKKALSDPRIYQTFRWRINCTFRQEVTSRIVRGKVKQINCGIVVTSRELESEIPSRAPYALYNLSRSRYNSGDIEFRNPTKNAHSDEDQSHAKYWFVNIDEDDLSEYDFLIWASSKSSMDLSQYIPKLNDFTENKGGTLFFDTGNWTDVGSSLGVLFSAVFHPTSGSSRGVVISGDSPTSPATLDSIRYYDEGGHHVIDGNARLGGWDLKDEANNNPPIQFMSHYQRLGGTVYTQYGVEGFDRSIIEVQQGGSWYPALMERTTAAGSKFLSTLDIAYTASAIFAPGTGSRISDNFGTSISGTDRYQASIDGLVVEGAMKLLYNIALSAVKHRSIHDADSDTYSTTWTYSTPWCASWTISAGDGVLTSSERDRFDFLVDARDIYADTPDTEPVWKRRLSSRTIETLVDDALEPLLSDPVTANRVDGAERQYSIELTNPNVHAASKAIPSDYLNVWTEAYTPRFTVPSELGKHIIREEMDPEGRSGRALQYDSMSYTVTDYPEKQYRGRVITSYNESEELTKTKTVNYTATGTARATSVRYVTRTQVVYNTGRLTTSENPEELEEESQVAKTSYRDMHWANALPDDIEDPGSYLSEGYRWERSYSNPDYGVIRPKTIRTWQADNYYSNPSQCWPYWGVSERLEFASQGDVVRFFQDSYNRFVGAGYLEGDKLRVDGFFGRQSESAAKLIQATLEATYQDGVVDAETWYIIGSQVLRLKADGYQISSNSDDWTRFYSRAENLNLSRVSDGETETWVAKRSSQSGSSSDVREYYLLQFDKRYVINGVNITPYIEGDADSLVVETIDVTNRSDLVGYDPNDAKIRDLGLSVEKDQATFIPLGPAIGSSIIVGVSQSQESGQGKSRFLGLRNISVRVRTEDDTYFFEEDPIEELDPLTAVHMERLSVPEGGAWEAGTQRAIDPNASGTPVVDWTAFGRAENDGWRPGGYGAVYYPGTANYDRLISQVQPHVKNTGTGVTTEVTSRSVTYAREEAGLMPWRDSTFVESYSAYYIRESDGAIIHDTMSRFGKPKTVTVRRPVYSTRTINFTTDGSVDVKTLEPKTIQVSNPRITGYHRVSNFVYQNITVDDPDVIASIDSSGRASFLTYAYNLKRGAGVKEGPVFPNGASQHLAMDENGRINPVPEVGAISKADGIKLLCNPDGSAYGFPELPVGVGQNEHQRHYSKLALITEGSDASVYIGFYDKARQEFVTSSDGSLQMSYIDYVKRGPQNVYIGVICDYEESYESIIPTSEDDAPRVPYKWAMPLYAIGPQSGSRITLEPLPPKLGKSDLWPVVVRDGSFSRYVHIRERKNGPLSGWAANYQDSTVRAFYSLPEAKGVSYSRQFGPPHADILSEEPIILDDRVIQVRQAPILTYVQATANPGPADPRRPALTLYRRASRTSPWYEQPYSQIRDYNSSTGELFLRDPIYVNDPGLLKVDYTTTRAGYSFKRYQDLILNLNTYSSYARGLVGEAITVYIVPAYAKDEFGAIIPDSVQQRTLRASLDRNVFNPASPDYDPLAVQLGVIYLTTALDVSDLTVLDTRRRGGGLKDNANIQEVNRLINEAWHYWDISHGAGQSYPKSGYVVVRLPEELQDKLPEYEIKKTIERNITAGTSFKIETLQGTDWGS